MDKKHPDLIKNVIKMDQCKNGSDMDQKTDKIKCTKDEPKINRKSK